MAKYNELVEKYADDIARIKRLQAQEKEAREKLISFEASANWDNYDHAAFEELQEEAGQFVIGLSVELDKLTQDIEAEYWDVPFAAPRKKGIEKFFEVAGL